MSAERLNLKFNVGGARSEAPIDRALKELQRLRIDVRELAAKVDALREEK